MSSRAHARELSQDGGSHEVVWCPIARSRGPSTSSRLGDDPARLFGLIHNKAPRGGFDAAAKNSRRISGNFWRARTRKIQESWDRLLWVQKISQILKFP